MATDKGTHEDVLREFPPIGKYRVRLVNPLRGGASALDIREYISADGFEGFTRRGIRLSPDQLPELLAILEEIRDAHENPARFNGRNYVHDADNVLLPAKRPARKHRAKAAEAPEIVASTSDRRTVAEISAAARRGEQIALTGPGSGSLLEALQREHPRKTAPAPTQAPQDVRPLMDEILDATQKHLETFTETMPPTVQAKAETQKRLPLAVVERGPAAPAIQTTIKDVDPFPKKSSLSELAALL